MSSLSAGTRVGPYEILGLIGAGGMGEVYKASDTRLNRAVAIKVLPPQFSENLEMKQRFEREAQTIAQLSHPHICTLHDVGMYQGATFLVMEYLEGETLAQRLERGALPLSETLKLAREIADALDKAHRQGIIHRDLKPSNVMLTKAGAKLLDFGLAKLKTREQPAGVSTLATRTDVTAQGTILGTLQYMAPEQLEGMEADARTDIFALGAVLYETATGTKAFEGKSQASLIAAIMSVTPERLWKLQPTTPPVLDFVVRTCLAKDPEDRWQTAREITHQLKWIAEGGAEIGIGTPAAVPQKKKGWLAWALFATASLLAIAMAVPTFLYFRGAEARNQIRFLVSVPTMPNAATLAVSPDGRWIAFSATSEKTTALFIREIGSTTPRQLAGTDGASQLFWSADSRQIAFLTGSRLRKVDVSGGSPQTICEVQVRGWAGATWNSEGTILFANVEGLHRVPAAGGEPVTIIAADPSSQGIRYGGPNFLPDGRHFLYRAGPVSTNAIYVGSLDSAERKQVLTLTDQSKLVYAEPGFLFYLREGTLFAQPFDASELKITGDPIRIADDISYNPSGNAAFDVSDNGVLVYRTGGATGPSQVVWFDRTGKRQQSVGEPGQYSSAFLSPDGKQIAVRGLRPTTSSPDIWLIEWERSVFTRFTFGSADELPGDLAWSPDGLQVAFSSRRKGNPDIFLKNVNRIAEEIPLLDSPGQEYAEDWSKDGRYLAYSFRPASGSAFGLYVLPFFGDRKPFPVVQSPFDVDEPHFSYDGKWLAYDSIESGTWQTYVTSFPAADRKRQVSTNGGKQPRWRQDGTELYYLDLDGKLMAVAVTLGTKIDSGIPRELFDTGLDVNLVTDQYDVTPDGQRFLVLAPVSEPTPTPLTVVVNWAAALRK